MRGHAYVAPVVVLLTCAGLCGGGDLAARRSARSPANPDFLGEPPPTPTAPPATPRSERSASKHPEYPPATPVSVLTSFVNVAKDAASLYGHCRNEGTWMFTFMRDRAVRTLADPAASEERRTSAQQALDMYDGLILDDGPIGDTFRVCGMIGPAEPPPWLATVPLPPGGPRPSPPSDEDATRDDTALTEDSRSDPQIVVVEPSVAPR